MPKKANNRAKGKGKKKAVKARAKRDPMLTQRNPLQVASGLNVRIPPSTPWLKLAHGHLNPFLSDAMGLKVPDNNSAESFTYRTVGRYMYLADGTAKTGGHSFAPSLLTEYTNWTTSSTLSTNSWVSASTSSNGGYGNVASASNAIRIVSWGVRIFCTCSYDKANGQVIIATKRGASGGSPGTAPNDAQVIDPNSWIHWEVVALKDLDHVWTSEKLSKEVSEAYNDPSVGGLTATDISWTNLVVFLLPNSGQTTVPPAGCAYGFEVVKNLECLPLVGTIANGLTTPAAVEDQRVTSLVNRAQASVAPVLPREHHGPTMLSALYAGVKDLALDAVGWALPHVGRGIAARLGGRQHAIMDVD